MVIKSFTDHAANERTFLAWVRTGIAIMAFGFLVARFDIFLKIAAAALNRQDNSVTNQAFGNMAGLFLITVGAGIILFSGVRFRKISKAIDSTDIQPGLGTRLALTLSIMLVALGVALAIYVTHAIS